jgi:hypothetical protein
MLIGGLNALSHIDYCGGSVMHQGDWCPNTSGRSHHSWLNDYDDQKARNHRLGVIMTVAGAATFIAASLVWRYGTLNVFRILSRRSASPAPNRGRAGRAPPAGANVKR